MAAGTQYELLKDGFVIDGKRINLLINFQHYSKKRLINDYEKLIKYHTKQTQFKNPKSEIDLKFFHTIGKGNFPGITYQYFESFVRRFATRIFYQILSEDHSKITSDFLEIQLKVVGVKNREWYGAHDEDLSDPEHAFLEVNGMWLLNELIIPYIVFRRIDYTHVFKRFEHELGHQRDWCNKIYRSEERAKQKILTHERRAKNWSMFHLYLAFENLRVEGVHEYSNKRYMERIDINMDWAKNYRKLVEKLMAIKTRKASEEFFEENLGSTSHQGIYYVGRLAAHTIALAVAKKEGMAGGMVLVLPKGKTAPLSGLNEAMRAHKIFYVAYTLPTAGKLRIAPLPEPIFEKALQLMLPVKYIEFILLYEWACNELGISPENRIVTYGWFNEINQKARQLFSFVESKRLLKAKSKGYSPVPYIT